MASEVFFRPLSAEEARSIASHPLSLVLYAEILKVQANLASQISVQFPTQQGPKPT